MIGGIVAVHAHPDDESITMGATLARYAAAGVPVTLVTATLGEQGELMHGRLGGLAADRADQLGGFRLAELHAACGALGIADQRMLGGIGSFRDSGMAGTPSAAHPSAFVHAQRGGPRHAEAVSALLDILDEVRPAVVLSYDATGGYGHPDHIAAHQVAGAAVEHHSTLRRSAVRLCEVVRPRRALEVALESLWAAPLPAGFVRPEPGALGTLTGADGFDCAIPAGPFAAARRAAMRAHATQLDVWSGAIDGFALTDLRAQPLLGVEYFRVLAGPPSPPGSTDLFAGL